VSSAVLARCRRKGDIAVGRSLINLSVNYRGDNRTRWWLTSSSKTESLSDLSNRTRSASFVEAKRPAGVDGTYEGS
jgi:hypothetical protein